MYTRRTRLLDEELLDEEKDISGNLPINFTSSQSSMVMSTQSNQSNSHNEEIFSTNKTDSEKFNEIQSKEVLIATVVSPEKKPLVERECELKVFKNSDSTSSETDLHGLHDNILLRRQQLTRVAEWVQNSSNIPLTHSPGQKLNDVLIEQTNLDLENNNLLDDKQNYASLNNQVYKDSIPLIEINAAQNCLLDEKLNIDESSVLCSAKPDLHDLNVRSDEVGDEKLDLAQMEYNVKKFLLKQNEWSMSRALSMESLAYASNSNGDDDSNDETIFIKSSYQRTETNL